MKNPTGEFIEVSFWNDKGESKTEIYTAYEIGVDISEGCLLIALNDDQDNLDESYCFASGVWSSYHFGYVYSEEDQECSVS